LTILVAGRQEHRGRTAQLNLKKLESILVRGRVRGAPAAAQTDVAASVGERRPTGGGLSWYAGEASSNELRDGVENVSRETLGGSVAAKRVEEDLLRRNGGKYGGFRYLWRSIGGCRRGNLPTFAVVGHGFAVDLVEGAIGAWNSVSY
jgi:hypothetical protein